jgi:hypothetical protein
MDVSIYCIMCYNTVPITLLLSVPCFSLYCTPLQVVRGEENPFKYNLQPQKELIFLANTWLPFQLVSHSNRELYIPSTRHCESVSSTFHTLWFWTQKCSKSVLGKWTQIVPRLQYLHLKTSNCANQMLWKTLQLHIFICDGQNIAKCCEIWNMETEVNMWQVTWKRVFVNGRVKVSCT